MAWVTGSVTGHDNLLIAFRDFITTNATLVGLGQNWTLEKEETIPSYLIPGITGTAATYGANFHDLYLRGPGLAGTDNIYVNIRSYTVPSIPVSNWFLCGATDYDNTAAWEEQLGNCIGTNYTPVYTLVSSSITYWFIANGRRFIIICKIGGDFYLSYCGFILPYGLPSEYPYPLLITGTATHRDYEFSNASYAYNYYNTSLGVGKIRHRNGIWNATGNSSTSSTVVWPWLTQTSTVFGNFNLIGNGDGSFPLLPAVMYSQVGGLNIWGEPQGLYFIPGSSPVVDPVAEDIVQIGGVDHLVIQNCMRTDKNELAAIRLE